MGLRSSACLAAILVAAVFVPGAGAPTVKIVVPSGFQGNGSTCDVCREADRRSATVLSLRPDGTDLRVVARGLRNAFEYLSNRHGRKVMRIELGPGGRAKRVTEFARGLDHPLALAIDRDGALLVADRGRGVIYRIQSRGG